MNTFSPDYMYTEICTLEHFPSNLMFAFRIKRKQNILHISSIFACEPGNMSHKFANLKKKS